MLAQADAFHLPLKNETVHCAVTSPPYWGLRDYRINGQLGLEPIPDCLGWATGSPCGECYVCHMVTAFREVRRVLRPDGTVWLNLGDSYCSSPPGNKRPGASEKSTLHRVLSERYRQTLDAGRGTKRDTSHAPGLKPKDLIGIPWRVALALQADGWWLRTDIIWHKPNPMPESVTDRPTRAHEYLFLLVKSARYYYNADAVKEPASPDTYARYTKGRSSRHKWADGGPGNQTIAKSFAHMLKKKNLAQMRNKRSVWTITTEPFSGSHFATFPQALVKPCILAGCPEGGVVLDCFCGSGTTVLVAESLNRQTVGLDLSFSYLSQIAHSRVSWVQRALL